MSEPVFIFDRADPAMTQANESARRTFKYFWRELSWERRRIIPGLDMSSVKFPFSEGPRSDGNPEVEQMWIGDLDFDGETVSGKLLNSPNWLTGIQAGAGVCAPFRQLSDWMMVVGGRTYGGFTVHAMRAKMSGQERRQHDSAWGLEFGDPSNIQVECWAQAPAKGFFSGLFGGRRPQNARFQDHPMCINMLEKIEERLKSDPAFARTVDDEGWTMLQREALAGNFGVVKLLIQYGADRDLQTPSGQNAAALARGIGWPEIADFLEGQ